MATAQTAKPTPTFTKDVARIFQDKCESCHRPDSIAPMSLVTYEESRPWARAIKNRVDTESALLDELIVDQRETWVREMLQSTASE